MRAIHPLVVFIVIGCLAPACPGGGVSKSSGGGIDPDAISAENCPKTCDDIPVTGACAADWMVQCAEGVGVCIDCAANETQCGADPVTGQAACLPIGSEPPACVPSCEGQSCGSNGCGGSCGFCPSSGICDGRKCHLLGEPCGDIGDIGGCLGNALATCVNDALHYLDCSEIDRVCAYNPTAMKFDCLLP